MEFSGMICVSWLRWAGWHLGGIWEAYGRHPEASEGIWEAAGKHLGSVWGASGKHMASAIMVWLGLGVQVLHAYIDIILKVILWLKLTSHAGGVAIVSSPLRPRRRLLPSHVTSQPFGCLAGVLDILYLACLAELASQVGFFVKGGTERTSVAVFCLFLPD